MKYILELNKYYKNQIEILYKDKNLLCIIPKTQEASKLYATDCNWCQKNISGFYGWSLLGNNTMKHEHPNIHSLLIRFIFKNKDKVRLTVFIENSKILSFHWASKNGQHVFEYEKGKSNRLGLYANVFSPLNIEPNTLSLLEESVYKIIKMIPDKCKYKISKYILDNIKVNYSDNSNNYFTKKETNSKKLIDILLKKYGTNYEDMYIEYRLSLKYNLIIDIFYYDNNKKEYTKTKICKNLYECEKFIEECLNDKNKLS